MDQNLFLQVKNLTYLMCNKFQDHEHFQLSLICTDRQCEKVFQPICLKCYNQNEHNMSTHLAPKQLNQVLQQITIQILEAKEQLYEKDKVIANLKNISDKYQQLSQTCLDIQHNILAFIEYIESIDLTYRFNQAQQLIEGIVQQQTSEKVLRDNLDQLKNYFFINDNQFLLKGTILNNIILNFNESMKNNMEITSAQIDSIFQETLVLENPQSFDKSYFLSSPIRQNNKFSKSPNLSQINNTINLEDSIFSKEIQLLKQQDPDQQQQTNQQFQKEQQQQQPQIMVQDELNQVDNCSQKNEPEIITYLTKFEKFNNKDSKEVSEIERNKVFQGTNQENQAIVSLVPVKDGQFECRFFIEEVSNYGTDHFKILLAKEFETQQGIINLDENFSCCLCCNASTKMNRLNNYYLKTSTNDTIQIFKVIVDTNNNKVRVTDCNDVVIYENSCYLYSGLIYRLVLLWQHSKYRIRVIDPFIEENKMQLLKNNPFSDI